MANIDPTTLIRPRDPAPAALILRDPRHANAKVPYAEIRGLLAILSWRRPFDSDGEELFARHYLDPIVGMTQDDFRNRHLHIPYEDGAPCNVIWSCHIDTCHHDEGYQRLAICNDDKGIAYVRTRRGEGNCLGADDGTGVWLMLEMIAAKRPGRYIFHRGEERGCKGSQWILDNNPAALENATAAIAFDRKDFNNIITHQGGERGCSEAFAASLATMLPGYKADPTGLFTDTRKYFKKVPECTNLSVGYQGQHGPLERQYLDFAVALRTAVLALDTKRLTIERDPTKVEHRTYGGEYYNNNGGGYKGRTSYRPTEVYTARGSDPNNQDPAHWIHKASNSSGEFYVWSRKESRNILRIDAKFIFNKPGSEGGYVTMTQAEKEKATKDRTASRTNTRAEDADDDLNPDDELFDLQLEIDLDRTLGELCFTYPTAAAKLLEAYNIDANDMLQMVYGERLDEIDDADEIDDDEDAEPSAATHTDGQEATTRGLVVGAEPETETVYCGLCQGNGNLTQCQFPTEPTRAKCCLRMITHQAAAARRDNQDDATAEGEAMARAFADHDADKHPG